MSRFGSGGFACGGTVTTESEYGGSNMSDGCSDSSPDSFGGGLVGGSRATTCSVFCITLIF
ncbi:hypothetical protein A2U01_0112523, partial [Trifolium medium]|nr:hypothetical protein [Trifolium medium]